MCIEQYKHSNERKRYGELSQNFFSYSFFCSKNFTIKTTKTALKSWFALYLRQNYFKIILDRKHLTMSEDTKKKNKSKKKEKTKVKEEDEGEFLINLIQILTFNY